jgi:hypothetical protein
MKFSKHFDLVLLLGQIFPYGWVFGERNILKGESTGESIVTIGIPDGEQGMSNDHEFEEFIIRTLRSIDYKLDSAIRFAGYKLKEKHIGKDKKKKFIVHCLLSPSVLH